MESEKVKYLKNNQEISVEESLKKIIPKLKETEVKTETTKIEDKEIEQNKK